MAGTHDVTVQRAEPPDRLAVQRLVDAALLSVEDLVDRLADGTVLLASVRDSAVGTAVLAPEGPDGPVPEAIGAAGGRSACHVRAIAVRRRRRGRGVGRRLLAASRDRFGPLVADCEPDVAPFYEAVGATVRRGPDGRQWALLAD